MSCGNSSLNNDVASIAGTLAMHTAAMKPSYLRKEDIPESAKQQAIEDQKEQTLQKLGEDAPADKKEKALLGATKSAISKLEKAECLLEQELATSEGNETVAQFLKSEAKRLGADIQIRNWALF